MEATALPPGTVLATLQHVHSVVNKLRPATEEQYAMSNVVWNAKLLLEMTGGDNEEQRLREHIVPMEASRQVALALALVYGMPGALPLFRVMLDWVPSLATERAVLVAVWSLFPLDQSPADGMALIRDLRDRNAYQSTVEHANANGDDTDTEITVDEHSAFALALDTLIAASTRPGWAQALGTLFVAHFYNLRFYRYLVTLADATTVERLLKAPSWALDTLKGPFEATLRAAHQEGRLTRAALPFSTRLGLLLAAAPQVLTFHADYQWLEDAVILSDFPAFALMKSYVALSPEAKSLLEDHLRRNTTLNPFLLSMFKGRLNEAPKVASPLAVDAPDWPLSLLSSPSPPQPAGLMSPPASRSVSQPPRTPLQEVVVQSLDVIDRAADLDLKIFDIDLSQGMFDLRTPQSLGVLDTGSQRPFEDEFRLALERSDRIDASVSPLDAIVHDGLVALSPSAFDAIGEESQQPRFFDDYSAVERSRALVQEKKREARTAFAELFEPPRDRKKEEEEKERQRERKRREEEEEAARQRERKKEEEEEHERERERQAAAEKNDIEYARRFIQKSRQRHEEEKQRKLQREQEERERARERERERERKAAEDQQSLSRDFRERDRARERPLDIERMRRYLAEIRAAIEEKQRRIKRLSRDLVVFQGTPSNSQGVDEEEEPLSAPPPPGRAPFLIDLVTEDHDDDATAITQNDITSLVGVDVVEHFTPLHQYLQQFDKKQMKHGTRRLLKRVQRAYGHPMPVILLALRFRPSHAHQPHYVRGLLRHMEQNIIERGHTSTFVVLVLPLADGSNPAAGRPGYTMLTRGGGDLLYVNPIMRVPRENNTLSHLMHRFRDSIVTPSMVVHYERLRLVTLSQAMNIQGLDGRAENDPIMEILILLASAYGIRLILPDASDAARQRVLSLQ